MSGRWLILAAGAFLAIVAGVLLVEAWRPAASESLTAVIGAEGGSGVEASVRLTRPAWLRPGGSGDVTLEVTRVESVGSNPPADAGPQALVARLSGLGAEVTPGEEQAASWGASDRLTFAWRVIDIAADTAGASVSLSLRDYAHAEPTETVLWARLMSFDVRPPLVAPGWSLLVLAAGASLSGLFFRRPR